MTNPDTRDASAVAGALYFIVGRGTEGGPSSYHLSIAGVTHGTSDPHWGEAGRIVADSGYSLGTIQVDLGKRGTWPLGSTAGAALKPGETSYVDGIIGRAAEYAAEHHLRFTPDVAQLRSDLLTHGNGRAGRGTLSFIDEGTRDGINAWAGSAEGQRWIHRNMDYPQIANATRAAMGMLDEYGQNISEDRRLQTIAILAKTENQMPSQMGKFEKLLRDGGDYEAVLAKANAIKNEHPYYDGPKAASIAEQYKHAFEDPRKAAALDRAQAQVGAADFDPSRASSDRDFKEALRAVGQGVRATSAVHGALHAGSRGEGVVALQTELARHGFTGARGHHLTPDGDFGLDTKGAVEAFQRAQHMTVDGVAGPQTLTALRTLSSPSASLIDSGHPGNAMYRQALRQVHAMDAALGRPSDRASDHLAGALTAAAHAGGLSRIDHVVLSDDAAHAFAVQGELRSPLKHVVTVDVVQAVDTTLEQSGAEVAQSVQSRHPSSPYALHSPPPQATLTDQPLDLSR